MKIRAILAWLLLMASTTSALAEGPYLSVAGGISIIHDGQINVADNPVLFIEYDKGYGLNASAGYNIEPTNFVPFRLEFEFGYKNASVNRLNGPAVKSSPQYSEITVMSYMGNAFLDINTNSSITPYIGAGLGVLNGDLKSQNDTNVNYAFGYQMIVGAAYNVNKKLAIDISYRFQDVGSYFSDKNVDIDYKSSNFMAGLRYSF